ncbi:type II toxin-antitoxin system RatA family toxin [Halovivax cerinus]|uniref:Type II toxin-antitoxin system RatA family toxin n=1 Tax=Halovivax cerinus TaxID=1487865 RepID=A0ABD5NKI4_9EURY|nr:SRPBCC family protein [Halovivax cerinus]
MERIVLSTLVHRDPETVFGAVSDFTAYPQYAPVLDSVEATGDGGAGTRYELAFSWWKLSYTARSEVTAVEEPARLAWRLTADLDAGGEWRVDPEPESAPPDEQTASRLYFDVAYDPHTADTNAVSLPRFVSLDRVIGLVRPRLYEEAENVVRRLVADVEGESRDVDLTVHEHPGR